MPRYRVKSDEVDAFEFTPEMGRDVANPADDTVPHPSEIIFDQGRGYRFHGQTISFGDFVVRRDPRNLFVLTAADFKQRYELVELDEPLPMRATEPDRPAIPPPPPPIGRVVPRPATRK